MKMNEDGNVIGRLGALAVIAFTVWGVHRINCNEGYCPIMQKSAMSCCAPGESHAEAKPADAKAADAKPAAPAEKAAPAKH